jgi:uncharacterized protein
MSSQIEPVQSPCVGNCCLDDHDICLGCFRELEEIKVWSSVDNSSRDLILANARRREQEKMRERS